MRQVACVGLRVGGRDRGADRQPSARPNRRGGGGRRILPEYTQAAATSSVDKSVFSDVFCISPFFIRMFSPFYHWPIYIFF